MTIWLTFMEKEVILLFNVTACFIVNMKWTRFFKVTSELRYSSLLVKTKKTWRIHPFYSALVRSHLGCCLQFWGLQHKKNMDLLVWVQWKAMKMIRGLKCLSCEDRLKGVGVVQP